VAREKKVARESSDIKLSLKRQWGGRKEGTGCTQTEAGRSSEVAKEGKKKMNGASRKSWESKTKAKEVKVTMRKE